MKKEFIHRVVIMIVVILLGLSSIGYILLPAHMLQIAGINSTEQTDFLARTLGAALLALIPGTWSIREANNSFIYQNIVLGIVIYLLLSSVVDFYAFVSDTVSNVAIPSIIFRLALGLILALTRTRN